MTSEFYWLNWLWILYRWWRHRSHEDRWIYKACSCSGPCLSLQRECALIALGLRIAGLVCSPTALDEIHSWFQPCNFAWAAASSCLPEPSPFESGLRHFLAWLKLSCMHGCLADSLSHFWGFLIEALCRLLKPFWFGTEACSSFVRQVRIWLGTSRSSRSHLLWVSSRGCTLQAREANDLMAAPVDHRPPRSATASCLLISSHSLHVALDLFFLLAISGCPQSFQSQVNDSLGRFLAIIAKAMPAAGCEWAGGHIQGWHHSP